MSIYKFNSNLLRILVIIDILPKFFNIRYLIFFFTLIGKTLIGQTQDPTLKIGRYYYEAYFGIGASNSQLFIHYDNQNSNSNIFKFYSPRFSPRPHLGISRKYNINLKNIIGVGARFQIKGGRYTISTNSGPFAPVYDFNNYFIALLDHEYKVVKKVNIYNGLSFGWNASDPFGDFKSFSFSLLTGLNYKIKDRVKLGFYYSQDINRLDHFSFPSIKFYSFDISLYYKFSKINI